MQVDNLSLTILLKGTEGEQSSDKLSIKQNNSLKLSETTEDYLSNLAKLHYITHILFSHIECNEPLNLIQLNSSEIISKTSTVSNVEEKLHIALENHRSDLDKHQEENPYMILK